MEKIAESVRGRQGQTRAAHFTRWSTHGHPTIGMKKYNFIFGGMCRIIPPGLHKEDVTAHRGGGCNLICTSWVHFGLK